jgi:hypothetical protein
VSLIVTSDIQRWHTARYGAAAEADSIVSYEPDEDDVLVHRFDERHDDAYFALGTGFGVGKPNFYVTLAENGGERSWWLDPEQAEALGRRIIELATRCRQANDEREASDGTVP